MVSVEFLGRLDEVQKPLFRLTSFDVFLFALSLLELYTKVSHMLNHKAYKKGITNVSQAFSKFSIVQVMKVPEVVVQTTFGSELKILKKYITA